MTDQNTTPDNTGENNSAHDWRFFRIAAFNQVQLERGSDLTRLPELDQKLWAALSCPSKGLEMDERTLALIDSDSDGHIRAPELMAAIDWTAARLTNIDLLTDAPDPLPLSSIRRDTPEGETLYRAARQMLDSLGKPEAETLSVQEMSDRVAILAAMPLNGDGIITAKSTPQPALQAAIEALIAGFGSQQDSSGEAGITTEILNAGLDAVAAQQAWEAAAVIPAGLGDATSTAAAWAAFAAVREKIEDYFTRCALAAFDTRAATLMNSSEEALGALSPQTLHASNSAIAALPLAQIAANQPLPLTCGLNPAWQAAMQTFVSDTLAPLLGEQTQLSQLSQLTAEDWASLCTTLAPYGEWQASRPASPLDALTPEQQQALAAPALRTQLQALIEADLALASEAAALVDVERLARYTRDLARLCRNFVNFSDFYLGDAPALFQAGRLYLDGRCCTLCLKVLDPARHATLATLSGIYLAYCDCVRHGEKMTIAAAFTAGDADQLMVGRNGVFYDQAGNDWDATIVRIVEHPISLRQAFWAPYKRLMRLISEQVEKFASARAKSVEESQSKLVADAGKATTEAKAPAKTEAKTPAAPFDIARFAGIFAAIGLALGAVGTALATVVSGFLQLHWWQMPLVVLGIVLLISGPSMLLAFLKLRQRNLGPLLDASGWAINTRARINLPFGVSLTELAELPENATCDLDDPYPNPSSRYKVLLVGVLIGAGIAAAFLSNFYL